MQQGEMTHNFTSKDGAFLIIAETPEENSMIATSFEWSRGIYEFVVIQYDIFLSMHCSLF